MIQSKSLFYRALVKANAPFHQRAPPSAPCFDDVTKRETMIMRDNQVSLSSETHVQARAREHTLSSPECSGLFIERFGVVNELFAAARAFAFSTDTTHSAPVLLRF